MQRAMTKAAQTGTSHDERQWQAVMGRDRQRDDAFVYAVTTTRIFCRPSCPARRPKREHVRFYASSSAAVAAGFRPCRRCTPDAPSLTDRYGVLVAAACRTLEREDGPVPLAHLAREARLSPHHFHRIFRTLTGVTPRAYASAHRRGRIHVALRGPAGVTEAIYEAGFGSAARFYAETRASLGMTPTRYKEGAHQMTIEFAVGPCELGLVLVARTALGLCAILLGDDRGVLEAELRRRFPRATLVAGDDSFAEMLRVVTRGIAEPATTIALPLDVRGTAFQQRVWQALRAIPAGTTVTYAELAKRIGAPNAVRAVGAACGANPVAIAIPCHRVIGRDGSLTGYRWGVERKRALLDREAAAPAAPAPSRRASSTGRDR